MKVFKLRLSFFVLAAGFILSCGGSRTANSQKVDSVMSQAEIDLRNLIEKGYSEYADSDIHIGAFELFRRLELFYEANGLLTSKTKSGYTAFFKVLILSNPVIDMKCLKSTISELSSFYLDSTALVWSSMGFFELLSGKYDSELEENLRFKKLADSLDEFYFSYVNNTNTDIELFSALEELLRNYDEERFANDLSYRIFFINFAFVHSNLG
jgi:hypothetical protein